jgi:hypothetical protein
MQKYWLPWLVGMPAEVSRAICSLIFGGVLERLPRLRICFAHGGGPFPATIGRIEHGFNVRPDLCAIDNQHGPRKYIGRLYFDSLVHEPAKLDYLIKLVGADQIMLGSDYPFPLKQRISGRYGHLCNHGAATLLGAIDRSRLQHVIAAHLSRQNNTPEKARAALSAALDCAPEWIGVADQATGFDWRSL